MFKLISAALVVCALSAGSVPARAQEAATQNPDRQTQEQAERDRRQAEQERKAKDKDARKEPGTRCGRWKRGKA